MCANAIGCAVHHGGVRGDAIVHHVGEDVGGSPQQQGVGGEGAVPCTGDGAHLVLRHRVSVLRAHQLHGRRAAGDVHGVHHPVRGSHGVLSLRRLATGLHPNQSPLPSPKQGLCYSFLPFFSVVSKNCFFSFLLRVLS